VLRGCAALYRLPQDLPCTRTCTHLHASHGTLSSSHTLHQKFRVEFDQVRKKCAEPNYFCMVVSRFFQNPIQNNFSGIQNSHQNPLSRVSEPSGVVGYMRKQKFERTKAASPVMSSEVKPLVGVTERKSLGTQSECEATPCGRTHILAARHCSLPPCAENSLVLAFGPTVPYLNDFHCVVLYAAL
jgi:hypothetical protein